MAAETATLMTRLRAKANLVVFIFVPSLENLAPLFMLTLTCDGRAAVRGGAGARTDPTHEMFLIYEVNLKPYHIEGRPCAPRTHAVERQNVPGRDRPTGCQSTTVPMRYRYHAILDLFPADLHKFLRKFSIARAVMHINNIAKYLGRPNLR
jgi:hypothetical protein